MSSANCYAWWRGIEAISIRSASIKHAHASSPAKRKQEPHLKRREQNHIFNFLTLRTLLLLSLPLLLPLFFPSFLASIHPTIPFRNIASQYPRSLRPLRSISPRLQHGKLQEPRRATSGLHNRNSFLCQRRRSTRQPQHGEDTRGSIDDRRSHCMLVTETMEGVEADEGLGLHTMDTHPVDDVVLRHHLSNWNGSGCKLSNLSLSPDSTTPLITVLTTADCTESMARPRASTRYGDCARSVRHGTHPQGPSLFEERSC